MANLIFNIDKKLLKVFNFVLDYTDTDKTVLLEEWKESTDRQSIGAEQASSDKAPVEIILSDNELSDFNGFCKYVLRTTAPDEWFESHVRNYCRKKLIEIQQELLGNEVVMVDIFYPTNPGKWKPNAIPDEFWHYLVDKDKKEGKSVSNQYEIAFRCNIVPIVKELYGEDFFEISDINYLEKIKSKLRDKMDGPKNAAFNTYLKYLRG